MEMAMDFVLAKLRSFFGIELELPASSRFSVHVNICSVLLAVLGSCNLQVKIRHLGPICGPTFATLCVAAFVLAFYALLLNKTRKFLIPAAIMSPILSLVSLNIFFVMVRTSAEIVPIYLFEGIISAYYWVGLMTVFGLKNPVANPVANPAAGVV